MSDAMVRQVYQLVNPQLSRAAQRLLACLAHHTNKDTGFAYPGRRTLARELLVTERRIKQLQRELIGLGLLRIQEGRGRGHLSVYRLTLPVDTSPEKGKSAPSPVPEKGKFSVTKRGNFGSAPYKEVEQNSKQQAPGASPLRCVGYPSRQEQRRYCDYHRQTHFCER